jgi:hypothetical protein
VAITAFSGSYQAKAWPGFRRFGSVVSQTSALWPVLGLPGDSRSLKLKFAGEPAICGRIGFTVDGFG